MSAIERAGRVLLHVSHALTLALAVSTLVVLILFLASLL